MSMLHIGSKFFGCYGCNIRLLAKPKVIAIQCDMRLQAHPDSWIVPISNGWKIGQNIAKGWD
jgi:hypothetical protein